MNDDTQPNLNAPTVNYDDYNDFLKDADRDNRVGDHTFLITSKVVDTWPSGDPRIKIAGILTTANNAKADWTISPPPSPAVLAAEGKNYEQGKKRAIAQAISMYKVLAQSYGTTPERLNEGDELKVKTGKSKIDADGKGGFIRVVAIHPKDHTATNGTSSTSTVGF